MKRIEALKELAAGLPDADIQWAVEMLEKARTIMNSHPLCECKAGLEYHWLLKLQEDGDE
jgi:hypothetical protein